ncbi:hypothetical protein ACSAGD_02975 [Paramicrobacterium sp. CJ85]|uniref:hypothetical protein n=1 Tax=Paramicrobacterium sp. CJ85 TaxID=3445355 RepID=UPI003F611E94
MNSRALGAAVVLAASAALLTGCAGGQSVSDACDIFHDADIELVSAITSSSGSLLDDPATAKKDLNAAIADFEKSVSEVSNPDVKPAVDKMTKALKSFDEQFASAADAAVDDPDSVDSAALSEALTDAEKAEKGVVKACKGN